MNFTDTLFNKWKRKNVTLRGLRNGKLQPENGVFGSWGKGLYTCHLSNKAMAKSYGKVYFVLNARPLNPKKFQTTNTLEIFRQDFPDVDQMQQAVLACGFDGIEIPGREMVNYTPSNDIKYFDSLADLRSYFDSFVSIHQKAVLAGLEIASHCSDLYIPVNAISAELVKLHGHKSTLRQFTSQIDGKQWYEIAFAYDPYWDKREQAARRIKRS